MVDRKSQILEVASELLLERGFHAFSYRDLSDRLGITKASIHHHFPSKEALGGALVDRYRTMLTGFLDDIDSRVASPSARLDAYLEIPERVLVCGGQICPGGALQSCYCTLPASMQEKTRELLGVAKSWLAGVLEAGRADGTWTFQGDPADQALHWLATLQGALQVARVDGAKAYRAIVNQALRGMQPPAPDPRPAVGTPSASEASPPAACDSS